MCNALGGNIEIYETNADNCCNAINEIIKYYTEVNHTNDQNTINKHLETIGAKSKK